MENSLTKFSKFEVVYLYTLEGIQIKENNNYKEVRTKMHTKVLFVGRIPKQPKYPSVGE